jgi:hypothetical protein
VNGDPINLVDPDGHNPCMNSENDYCAGAAAAPGQTQAQADRQLRIGTARASAPGAGLRRSQEIETQTALLQVLLPYADAASRAANHTDTELCTLSNELSIDGGDACQPDYTPGRMLAIALATSFRNACDQVAASSEQCAGALRGYIENIQDSKVSHHDKICRADGQPDGCDLSGPSVWRVAGVGAINALVGLVSSGVAPEIDAGVAISEEDATLAAYAQAIGGGHAFAQHAIEFGAQTPEDLSSYVYGVLKAPDDVRFLERSRIAFWDDQTDAVVFYDPNNPDLGTVFRPDPNAFPNPKLDYFDKQT